MIRMETTINANLLTNLHIQTNLQAITMIHKNEPIWSGQYGLRNKNICKLRLFRVVQIIILTEV